MQLFFWSFGFLAILLFYLGIYLPVIISISAFLVAAWHLIRLYRQSRVGELTLLLFIVYTLPFIHIIPYIWFDFDAESPLIMWGLAVNPYMTDKTIIELMSMIGAVGAAGFMAGTSLLRRKLSAILANDALRHYCAFRKTLPLPVFFIWVLISIMFTWINAPADTIFTAAYTESQSISGTWNFATSWMFSYSFLLFALADCMFETSPVIAKMKRRIFLFAFLLIVVWFQLLRGDRESLPCIIGALLMYYVWGKNLPGLVNGGLRIKTAPMFLTFLVVAAVSYVFGALRSFVVGVSSFSELQHVLHVLGESDIFRFDNLLHGTWSGILLTPLSIAGDYINGVLPIKYGQTYLDLFFSTVPGFLADWIGYVRPIDSFRGPAWEMIYGGGGTHAVVTPFTDFRMAGVFIIIAFWSFIFAKIERYLLKHRSVVNLALLGIIAMAIPHWLWYGEKNIMNALIIWLIMSVLYRMRLVAINVNSMRRAYEPSNLLPQK